MKENTTLRYVHQDSLTSTSLMTGNTGSQIGTTMKYLPFGGTRSGSVPTDKKFTGQRLDTTGLYYYNARYYDPLIGRFISADTIVPNPADPQCFNRYSYCLNNPLKYIDPSGHLVGYAPSDEDMDYMSMLNEYRQLKDAWTTLESIATGVASTLANSSNVYTYSFGSFDTAGQGGGFNPTNYGGYTIIDINYMNNQVLTNGTFTHESVHAFASTRENYTGYSLWEETLARQTETTYYNSIGYDDIDLSFNESLMGINLFSSNFAQMYNDIQSKYQEAGWKCGPAQTYWQFPVLPSLNTYYAWWRVFESYVPETTNYAFMTDMKNMFAPGVLYPIY